MPARPSFASTPLQALTSAILQVRYAPFAPPATPIPPSERRNIARNLQALAALTTPEFTRHAAPLIVARYAILRFAQSARNGSFRITTEQLRRQIGKLRNADKRDPRAIDTVLGAMSPQALDRIVQSLQKAGVAVSGVSAQDLADSDRQHLAQAAADALEHPHLQKHARGRRPDRAGDALIDSARSAFETLLDEPIRIWADGVSVSRFVRVVQLLFALAGDPRNEATLRDRCRAALDRPPPQPPWQGVIFIRPN